MKEIFEQRIKELDAAIAANAHERNALKRVSLNRYHAQHILEEILSPENIDYDYFLDEPTQILYSKELLPPLIAKWLLFKKEYEVENRLLHSTGEHRIALFQEEMQKISTFFETNSDFCQYYYGQRTEDDYWMFTIHNPHKAPGLKKILKVFPVLNAGCVLAATLIANEEFSRLLQEKLVSNAGKDRTDEPKAQPKANWAGNEIDLVEQLMVLHASGIILVDGKPATQKWLIEQARTFYGLELKNWEQLAQKIKNRPADKQLCHHIRIMEAYLKRQDELLDKNPDRPRKKIKGL